MTYGSPFSSRGARSPRVRTREPGSFSVSSSPYSVSSSSPFTRDRFLDIDFKSPQRSSIRQENIRTPNTWRSPSQRDTWIPKFSVQEFRGPEILNELPTKLIDFNTDSTLCVAVDTELYVFDRGRSSCIGELGTQIHCVAWCDGYVVVSANGRTELIDIARQSSVRNLGTREGVRIGALSCHESNIALGDSNGNIHIYDYRARDPYDSYEGRGEVCALKWSPEGSSLASSFASGNVSIISEHIQSCQFETPVYGFDWLPLGVLIVGESDRQGTIHAIHTRSCDNECLITTGSQVSSICWSESLGICVGHVQPTAHGAKQCDWTIYTRDLRYVESFYGREGGTLNVEISPQGDTVVTVGCDRLLKVWTLQESQPSTPTLIRRTPSRFTRIR